MNRDTFGDYLRNIARYPLLTAEEEIVLARQVQRMIEIGTLDRKPTRTELREQRRGKLAEKKMINCNLRLVVYTAKKYSKSCGMLEMDDLIQEGSVGLHRAVEKFDPTKGYKFSTYAYWWIRQGVGRAIANQSRTIRLPIHTVGLIGKIGKHRRRLSQELGRMPTRSELAEAAGISEDKLKELMVQAQDPLSLDMRVTDESDLGDLMQAPIEDQPEAKDDWDAAAPLLEYINPDDRKMMLLYYGINDDGADPMTLVQLGKMFGLSRTRIGQRIQMASNRLRLLHNTSPR